MNPLLVSGAAVLTIWIVGAAALRGHVTFRRGSQ